MTYVHMSTSHDEACSYYFHHALYEGCQSGNYQNVT